MSGAGRPTLVVIAGPNGSGKSTFTHALLGTTGIPVIDPDEIARGIHPEAPEQAALDAGREALRRQQSYLERGESFAVETTLSGNAMLRLMEEAQRRSYALHLVFICTDRAEINIARVQQRVAQGGHAVPAEDVRRRYERSLRNLRRAIGLADQATLFDNTGERAPREVLAFEAGRLLARTPDLPRWVIDALGPDIGQLA